MKYVLVFVLLTCVLSASIKERVETAAAGKAQEGAASQSEISVEEEWCNSGHFTWICDWRGCRCKLD